MVISSQLLFDDFYMPFIFPLFFTTAKRSFIFFVTGCARGGSDLILRVLLVARVYPPRLRRMIGCCHGVPSFFRPSPFHYFNAVHPVCKQMAGKAALFFFQKKKAADFSEAFSFLFPVDLKSLLHWRPAVPSGPL